MFNYEILLMGDGSHLLRTIAWVLEYKGFAAKVTATPEAALEALVKRNYDLIIAKIGIKSADSFDILKRAKRLNPDMKVMIVSGNHEVTLPLEAYQVEVDDYILMPVAPTELWRRVRDCLQSLEVVDLKPEKVSRPEVVAEDKSLQQLSMVFHDLRGAMVSTSASLKLLSRGIYGEIDGSAGAKIDEITHRVDKLIDMAEEFIFKGLAAGAKLEVEREVLDLKKDVVDPVLAELTEEIHANDIKLENRLQLWPEGKIAVKGSKLWLKSVFRNLVNNGIKYGGTGCTIVIDWENRGPNCCLNVSNSGKPIPEERRSMIFANYRPKPQTARGPDRRGLGVGLSLSREIMAKQGGDIWYEAKPDGSRFVVSVPQS